MSTGTKLLLAILMAVFFVISGCASSEKASIAPYSPACLQHLLKGREYVASGRYELAREQYLMALAASNSSGATHTITDELHAVDLMVKTQR